MKTMTKILLLCTTLSALSSAQPNNDQDMDGVPDISDQCSNTPFLDEVNVNGCSTKTLIFPEQRDDGSLDIALGYGFSKDNDYESYHYGFSGANSDTPLTITAGLKIGILLK